MVVGDVAGDDANEVRGLAFKNFKTHLYVNTDNNIIEDNWFGLSDDGTEISLIIDEPEDGSGNAAISLQAGADNNVIQDNVFAGLNREAGAIRSDANTFFNNFVSATSDGCVPDKQTDPDLICTTVDWLGGGGITVEGDDHQMQNNVFAGVRQEIFHGSTQPSAIQVTGKYHIIQNNKIGVDEADTEVGVCGRGIYKTSLGGPEDIQVLTNTIVDPGLSGISLNGALYDANTLRGNVIKSSSDWPQVEGNPKPENAIQVGPSLPAAFQSFQPAKVTEIDEMNVSGTIG